LSLGRRDSLLLEIYEHLFGPATDAFAECPHCGEHLEYHLSIRDLLAQPRREGTEGDLTLSVGAWSLRLRLPNSLDLRVASRCSDIQAGRRTLLERCVVEPRQGGNVMPAAAIPESMVGQVAAYLAEADPQAEMLIDLRCTSCRYLWQVVMDIECFLWAKVNSLARRLLREVHVLAQAYGWRETDILALSATRRQFYLELVRS
jgi:hypothetical protein